MTRPLGIQVTSGMFEGSNLSGLVGSVGKPILGLAGSKLNANSNTVEPKTRPLDIIEIEVGTSS